MSNSSPHSSFDVQPPKFMIGDLIRHRRYGYRGVIVDFDMSCQADDAWYEKNQTQPDRDQPWYHVLVDGATVVTYTAQTSLRHDAENQPIHHPLVPYFFENFDRTHYERNDRIWPGWEGAGFTTGEF